MLVDGVLVVSGPGRGSLANVRRQPCRDAALPAAGARRPVAAGRRHAPRSTATTSGSHADGRPSCTSAASRDAVLDDRLPRPRAGRARRGARPLGAADRLPALGRPGRRPVSSCRCCPPTVTTSSGSSGSVRARAASTSTCTSRTRSRLRRPLSRSGARVVADHGDYLTLDSPGGFTFCLVDAPGLGRPPADRHGRRRSPTRSAWTSRRRGTTPSSRSGPTVTGWRPRPPRPDDEFARLTPADDQPLQLLLQRLDDEERHGARPPRLEQRRPRRRGRATRRRRGRRSCERFDRGWTVLTGPAGSHLLRHRPGDEESDRDTSAPTSRRSRTS